VPRAAEAAPGGRVHGRGRAASALSPSSGGTSPPVAHAAAAGSMTGGYGGRPATAATADAGGDRHGASDGQKGSRDGGPRAEAGAGVGGGEAGEAARTKGRGAGGAGHAEARATLGTRANPDARSGAGDGSGGGASAHGRARAGVSYFSGQERSRAKALGRGARSEDDEDDEDDPGSGAGEHRRSGTLHRHEDDTAAQQRHSSKTGRSSSRGASAARAAQRSTAAAATAAAIVQAAKVATAATAATAANARHGGLSTVEAAGGRRWQAGGNLPPATALQSPPLPPASSAGAVPITIRSVQEKCNGASLVTTNDASFISTKLPDHWRKDRPLPLFAVMCVDGSVSNDTKISLSVAPQGDLTAQRQGMHNGSSTFQNGVAYFADARFTETSGRGRRFNIALHIWSSVPHIVMAHMTVKVTVDGPRAVRTRNRRSHSRTASTPPTGDAATGSMSQGHGETAGSRLGSRSADSMHGTFHALEHPLSGRAAQPPLGWQTSPLPAVPMSATTLMLSRPTDSPTSGVGSAPLQMPEDMDYGAARFGHPYDTPMVSKAPTARTAKRRAQDHDAYDSMPIKHPATAPAATSRSFFGDSYATTGPPSEHIPMDALGLPFGTGLHLDGVEPITAAEGMRVTVTIRFDAEENDSLGFGVLFGSVAPPFLSGSRVKRRKARLVFEVPMQGKENAVEVLALFRRNGETMRSPEVLRFTYASSRASRG